MKNYHAVIFVGLAFTAGWAFNNVRIGIGVASIAGLVLMVLAGIVWAVKTGLGTT